MSERLVLARDLKYGTSMKEESTEKSLDEILAIEDPGVLRDELVVYLWNKSNTHSLASLTAIEKVVRLANECLSRIQMTGFADPLLVEPEHRDAMLDALSEIGARSVERILRSGAARFDAIDPEAADNAADIGELIELAGEKELDALNDELRATDWEGEIYARLTDYIGANLTRFRPH